ncbi:MAG: family 43 glycosylhydrolase [Paludibacter sp.]|nr:family 43 glycosylhydrolase [Paludibacter sp.]
MKQFTIFTILLYLLIGTSNCFSNNPLNLGEILTADPSGHVWKDGKMYLYTSHDEECQEDFWMKDWHVFSSVDLINWTDQGVCLTVDSLSWADNYAWAPDCAYKNGKYYFCFPTGKGKKDRVNPANSTKWMGIGIAVSDSPIGPFKDAIGAPLWTEPYANDPCLFIDDNGKGYIYFHGGDDYMVAEMSDDLLSVKGKLKKMDMGGYEPKMEGPWVFKQNGFYYYTMPENNRMLSYYMSTSPTGPWNYKGMIMEEENGNNHHSIVQFKGQWILFYHRWLKTNSSCEKMQRKVCAEYLYFNEDGTIKEVKRTDTGVGN